MKKRLLSMLLVLLLAFTPVSAGVAELCGVDALDMRFALDMSALPTRYAAKGGSICVASDARRGASASTNRDLWR